MNLSVPPFDNLKVRQAIAYAGPPADDRPGVARGRPWYSPGADGFGRPPPTCLMEHDVNSQAIAQRRRVPNGVDVTLNVYDTQKLASDVLSEQLKQAGIRVTQEVLDQPTFIGRVVQNQGINFALHCCQRQPTRTSSCRICSAPNAARSTSRTRTWSRTWPRRGASWTRQASADVRRSFDEDHQRRGHDPAGDAAGSLRRRTDAQGHAPGGGNLGLDLTRLYFQ